MVRSSSSGSTPCRQRAQIGVGHPAQAMMDVHPRQHAHHRPADAAVDVVEDRARAAAPRNQPREQSPLRVGEQEGLEGHHREREDPQVDQQRDAAVQADQQQRRDEARPPPEDRRQHQERRRRFDHQRPLGQELGEGVGGVLAHLQPHPGDDPLLPQHVVNRAALTPGRAALVHEIEPVDGGDLQQQPQRGQRGGLSLVGRRHPGGEVGGRLVGPRAEAGADGVDGEPAPERQERRPDHQHADGHAPQFSAARTRLCRLVVIANDSR